MKLLLWSAAAVLATSVSASAQSDPVACRTLSSPTSNAADATRAFSRSLGDLDLGAARSQLSGKELAAFDEMMEAQKQAIEPLRAFADRLEELSFVLRRCAR